MKSEIEKEFDEVSDKYFEVFEENYPLCITDQRPLSEHIAIMKKCIESAQKTDPPEYEEGSVY